jgi:hypothetical protein
LLPTVRLGHLDTLFRFQLHVGLRAAHYSHGNQSFKAYFLATSSPEVFQSLIPLLPPRGTPSSTSLFMVPPATSSPFPGHRTSNATLLQPSLTVSTFFNLLTL